SARWSWPRSALSASGSCAAFSKLRVLSCASEKLRAPCGEPIRPGDQEQLQRRSDHEVDWAPLVAAGAGVIQGPVDVGRKERDEDRETRPAGRAARPRH